MGKVILINPKFTEEITIFNLPISILHLGSWLMYNGYDVRVMDALPFFWRNNGDK